MQTKQQILNSLNAEQKKPVVDYFGPSIVVAAPGSGKTHMIVHRTAYMIAEGIDPYSILMFTFTRKGAKEIKERVESYIGPRGADVTVGTYHSFCMRLLRKYGYYLGWEPSFSVYDEDDKTSLLKDIIDNDDIAVGVVSKQISDWKDHMISPSLAEKKAENDFKNKIAAYYNTYQKRLKAQCAFDFDDLIYFAIRLFEMHPEVQAEVNAQYRYIVADEFQDSAERDIELILHLCGKDMNVCLVMDDEQSIYGWRGANIDSIFTLISEIKFKHFTLSRNYRSTKTIVSAARDVICKNSHQLPKKVYTENSTGEKIALFELPDTVSEALHVVRLILSLTKQKKSDGSYIKYGDIAVLYRMSYQSRILEEVLLKNSINYTIVGGLPFYGRKEIKDVMAYLRLLYNPSDWQALERAINTPRRGIGAKTLELLFDCFNVEDNGKMRTIHFLFSIFQQVQAKGCKGSTKKGLQQFAATLQRLYQFVVLDQAAPDDAIREVIRITKYQDYVASENDGDERIANLAELLEIATNYENTLDLVQSLSMYDIDKDQDQQSEKDDKIRLLTMHGSKGLEFPVVIIIGVINGTIPHHRADTPAKIAEERRLFYVAMTRAKELLFFTRALQTTTNGASFCSTVSRFIDDIDPYYIVKI